jgi:hypothetical protein
MACTEHCCARAQPCPSCCHADPPALRLERAVEHLERLVEPTTPVSNKSSRKLTLHLSPRSNTSPRSPGLFPRSLNDGLFPADREPSPGLTPNPRRARAVSTSTLYTPTPTAAFFPTRVRTMSTLTPRTGSDASHRGSQVGMGPPPPPSGHTREPSGRRAASVVSVGLGHAREPSSSVGYREYHAREPSGQRYPSRRGSQAAVPARRNSAYGYAFRRESLPPPPVVDDKYWVEGDFEIVTSDSVRFRVPSYYLFAAR